MKAVNFLLLASVIGIELFIGIVVTSYIFYPPSGIDGEILLDRFGSGLIMTQIFLKFGYFLLFVSFVNAAYESFSKNNKLKILKIILSVVILALSLLFVFYYTFPMLDLQAQVMSKEIDVSYFASEEFASFHKQSELLAKILVIFQALLFFLSFKTAEKEYNAN